MRCRGTIIKWDGARGFGFIAADDGGEDVFLHRSAITGGERHPQVGAPVQFDLDHDSKLRRKASKSIVGTEGPAKGRGTTHFEPDYDFRPSKRIKKLPSGKRSFDLPSILLPLSVPVVVLSAAVVAAERLWIPEWVSALYLLASGIAFLVYALDKYRAHKARWRIPESTLHLIEVAGGWPGAFAAQRIFRHKIRKLSFQVTYWVIVLAHLAFWSWFAADRLGWVKG